MDLPTFLKLRRPDWQRLDALLRRVEGGGLAGLEEAEAVEFGRLYRRAASDLNQAQTFAAGATTADYLNGLVARGYVLVYGKSRPDVWAFLRYLVLGYPAVFRRHFGAFLLAAAFLAGGAVFGFLASHFDPDARPFLFPPGMNMIQPTGEGEADDTPLQTSGELAGFSSFLFTHNLQVSLFAFALGITFGVGTAWLLWSNGVLLGALAAVFWEAGRVGQFATGIVPHGVLEIPACVLGGAAGFLLARPLLAARPWPRLEELQRGGKEALLLVAGCVPLLVAAAGLEAGVARAPDWFLSGGVKLAVAGVVGTLFVAYVALFGRGKARAAAEVADAAA
jgi:uncharacterized membrane protein SpoIIM required for sporulation